MKKLLLITTLVLVAMISFSCGKKETASSSSATGNALPQPDVNCGGSDCL